jgi:hypothetical protein
MYIPFSNIDLQARVWVYQADRKLTDEETAIITETLKASLDTWEAHGKRLTASGKVFENRRQIGSLVAGDRAAYEH